MRTADPFAPTPYTVKPRQTHYTELPLLIVIGGNIVTDDGELTDANHFDWRRSAPSLVVGRGLPRMVAKLDERYSTDPDFQWHATERTIQFEAGKVTTGSALLQTVVRRFGWRSVTGHNAGRNRAGHWHQCVCTDTFLTVPEVSELRTVEQIRQFAAQLTAFCRDNDVPVASTASAIAAQFLRDPRFYPDARRKVPSATNGTARPSLPGNYYQLYADTNRIYTALEIDQHNAHHYHARTVPMPNPNTLFARGDFDSKRATKRRDIGLDSELFHDFYGLHYVQLAPSSCTTPCELSTVIRRNVGTFLYSSEVPLLRDRGYRVTKHIASWGSYERDTGIRDYARWAEHELTIRPDCKHWLKPLLLSVYGMLAVTPREPTALFRNARGTPAALPAGGREWLRGFLVSHTKGRKVEPCVANVIQRGLIEAACRAESIGMADYLKSRGETVLQIYADSVIIEDNRDDHPLPFLPEPWQAKQPLSHYRPVHPSAFIAAEKVRLPGVTGRARVRMLARAGSVAPVKPRIEAVTGRKIGRIEQEKRGLRLRRV